MLLHVFISICTNYNFFTWQFLQNPDFFHYTAAALLNCQLMFVVMPQLNRERRQMRIYSDNCIFILAQALNTRPNIS